MSIEGDDVSPQAEQLELGIGERLTVEVSSDRAGEIHVHATPEEEHEVEPGVSSFTLSFDKPGAVDVEEHDSDTLLLRILVK